MPKIVDHDQRRIEIVEAVWRIIARGGFAAATMREIAAEAGFANGGLKHYFAGKDELLAAAFQHTFFRINERAAHAIGNTTGADAVRLLCLEMLPLDAERAVECRVAVAFWDRAASSKQLMKIYADSTTIWRVWMEGEFARSRLLRQIGGDIPDHQLVDELLALIAGLKVVPLLDAAATIADRQLQVIEEFFERLRVSGARLPENA